MLGRYLLMLLLGVLSVSAVRGAAAAEPSRPSPPEQQAPVASFAYVEPVCRDGAVGYVLRFSGARPAGEVMVRVRESPRREGKGDVVFGSADGRRTPVRAKGLDGMLPDPAPDGRPWPLFFAEPPPRGAPDREFRVELSAHGTTTIQWLTISSAEGRWKTSSKRIRLHGRPGRLIPLPAIKEAQEQVVGDGGRFWAGRPAIFAVTGLLLVGLALAVLWAPRERSGERPSPEQRGTEGKGVLVMLIIVLVASGAMVLRYSVE